MTSTNIASDGSKRTKVGMSLNKGEAGSSPEILPIFLFVNVCILSPAYPAMCAPKECPIMWKSSILASWLSYENICVISNRGSNHKCNKEAGYINILKHLQFTFKKFIKCATSNPTTLVFAADVLYIEAEPPPQSTLITLRSWYERNLLESSCRGIYKGMRLAMRHRYIRNVVSENDLIDIYHLP